MNKYKLKEILTIFVMDISKILKYSDLENMKLVDIRHWIDQWINQNIKKEGK